MKSLSLLKQTIFINARQEKSNNDENDLWNYKNYRSSSGAQLQGGLGGLDPCPFLQKDKSSLFLGKLWIVS